MISSYIVRNMQCLKRNKGNQVLGLKASENALDKDANVTINLIIGFKQKKSDLQTLK